MRISRASLALIRRVGSTGEAEFLTQWNARWQAFSLIGGHVEADESFRDCCIREVAEELSLNQNVDFRVAPQPLGPRCEYTAMSRAAGALTQYQLELFATELLGPAAMAKVAANPHNRWVSADEIHRRVAADDRPVAEQVATVFASLGVIA